MQVSGSNWKFTVARYNSGDRSIDTFDTDGKLTTAFGSGNIDYLPGQNRIHKFG